MTGLLVRYFFQLQLPLIDGERSLTTYDDSLGSQEFFFSSFSIVTVNSLGCGY